MRRRGTEVHLEVAESRVLERDGGGIKVEVFRSILNREGGGVTWKWRIVRVPGERHSRYPTPPQTYTQRTIISEVVVIVIVVVISGDS